MPTLGKVGIVDKGNYSASATYNSGDFVTYNGSTFLAIKDGVKGIAPSDDKTNWKYLAKGFNEPAASGITVTDTHGIIDGSEGKKTFAQNLFDGIGNWIITKAVTNDTFVNKLTERLINNGTATLEGFALDARQGNPTVEGSLAKQISKLNKEKAKVTFKDIIIQTVANSSVKFANDTEYFNTIPVIWNHSADRNSIDIISRDSKEWIIYSNKEQQITIRMFTIT